MTSPQLAGYVKIEVWDKQGGAKVGEYVFNDPAEFNSFFIPTEPLTIGRGYELRISAINRNDKTAFAIIRNDQGEPSTQLLHEFVFDPSSAYPSLEVLSIAEQSGDLAMNVSITNPDLVGGFDGWLVDEGTNTQVPNSNFTSPALSTISGTITIPMKANRIADGKYSVVVRVLAKNNNVFSTTIYPGVTYQAPSIFQRIGVALVAAPIVMAGILLIVLGLVGFMMYNSSRQKSFSGTPVLQGRLGENLPKARKSGDPVIPVADNEPIPVRRPTPVAPAPVNPPAVVSLPQASSNEATMIGSSLMEDATMVMPARVQSTPYLTGLNFPASLPSIGRVKVDQFPFIFGRSEGNLIIQEASISRRHAQITYDFSQQTYYLTDLNSSNGTTLNGQRLTPERSVQLTSGSTIGLGPNITIRFDLE